MDIDPAPVIALEQMHIGPVDDTIEHLMNAFCPCFPALAVETETAEGDRVQVIVYRHNHVGAAAA